MSSRTFGNVKVTWEGTTFVRQEGDVLYFTDSQGGDTDTVNIRTGVITCTRGTLSLSVGRRQNMNASASGNGAVYQSGGDQVIRRD